jgi:hypothetical protein
MLTLVLALSLPLLYRLSWLKGFFPLESVHDAHVVQELDGLNVLTLRWWSRLSCF